MAPAHMMKGQIWLTQCMLAVETPPDCMVVPHAPWQELVHSCLCVGHHPRWMCWAGTPIAQCYLGGDDDGRGHPTLVPAPDTHMYGLFRRPAGRVARPVTGVVIMLWGWCRWGMTHAQSCSEGCRSQLVAPPWALLACVAMRRPGMWDAVICPGTGCRGPAGCSGTLSLHVSVQTDHPWGAWCTAIPGCRGGLHGHPRLQRRCRSQLAGAHQSTMFLAIQISC